MSVLISDIAQGHMGNFELACLYVDMLADCGVDVAKFQVHYPEDQPSRGDYWAKTGFSNQEWVDISTYTRSKNLDFVASPFSLRAVDLLNDIGQPFWKIASGQITNLDMIEKIAMLGQPIILSCGLCKRNELLDTMDLCRKHGADACVMLCSSVYPTPPELCEASTGLSISDHSGTIWPSIHALANDAKYVEFHCTFDKSVETPDAESSLLPEQIKKVVEAKRFFEKMGTTPYSPSEEMRSKYLWPVK